MWHVELSLPSRCQGRGKGENQIVELGWPRAAPQGSMSRPCCLLSSWLPLAFAVVWVGGWVGVSPRSCLGGWVGGCVCVCVCISSRCFLYLSSVARNTITDHLLEELSVNMWVAFFSEIMEKDHSFLNKFFGTPVRHQAELQTPMI